MRGTCKQAFCHFTGLEIFSYFNPFLRRRKTHWVSEFIIFYFFHSPFSFVNKDGGYWMCGESWLATKDL